jgi:hypothetical protein
MAEGTINFTYPVQAKSIGGFEIDAFLVESYNFSNSLTSLAVEEGSNISDHVVEEPDTLDIEAFIGAAKFETYTGEIPDDLSKVEIPEDPKTRIRQAYHELLRLKRSRQPVDVVTGLDTFTNMVITSLNISRDAENGADLPFSMSFQKIDTVKSEETQISVSPSSSSASDQAGGTANIGQTGRTEAPREDFVERANYDLWREGKMSAQVFTDEWGETPQQFAARHGG